MPTAPYATAPSGQNELLGRGKLYFDRFVTNTLTRTGELDIGNCTEFSIEPSTEVKEKYESMDPQSLLYARAITRQGCKIKITGDEFALDTLASVLMGDVAQLTQTTQTATAKPLVTLPVLGRWYPTGWRAITVTSVKQGATTLVAGTDYVVDTVSGRIKLLPGGAATATATTWDGSAAATTLNMVRGSNVGSVDGYLRFVGNPVKGPTFEAEFFHVSFNPSGALGFITDDFGNWQLEGELIADAGPDAQTPFYRILQTA